jgi:hypothetical protein
MSAYVFDLDGTLCTQDPSGEYENAEPIWPMIRQVRRLLARGHSILIFTARGSGTGRDCRELTSRQLAKWGLWDVPVQYGKPPADIYVDDRSMRPDEWLAGARDL